MTKIQPPCTCLRQDCTQTGLSDFKMFGAIKAERLCSLLFSYPVLFGLLVLTSNHVIKCTLLLSCLHRSDYIFTSGFIGVERLEAVERKRFGKEMKIGRLPSSTE